MRSLVVVCVVALTGSSLAGCGVAGNRGAAIFHVGANWAPVRPIALGSVFAASAHKNGLIQTQLKVTSAHPTVIENLETGSLRAKAVGEATLEAKDPVSQALVDTLDFEVAQPSSVALAAWIDLWIQPTLQAPDKFALALGSRSLVAVSVLDAKARRLHHMGIAAANCDKLKIAPVGELLEVTATTAGSCTGTLAIHGLDGKPVLSRTYEVQVVDAPQVAKLELKAATVKLLGAKPTATDAPPPTPDADAKPASNGTWWLLSAQAALADGTRVYGAATQWSESGGKSGHLLATKSDGGNWLLLQAGEQVTVTATVGAVQAQATLGP
jgi:hypothetical protein